MGVHAGYKQVKYLKHATQKSSQRRAEYTQCIREIFRQDSMFI